jgi:hypothetical protein
MHSSPDLDAHDDEMFPDEALPATPRNPASFALDPTAELSPPNSQGPVNLPRGDGLTTTGASRVNANGKRPLSLNAQASGTNELHHDAETGYSWSRQEDQPGFAWKNPRTKDEEHRALDQIVDKNSQIKSEDVLQIAYEDPTDTYSPLRRPSRRQYPCQGEALKTSTPLARRIQGSSANGMATWTC